MEEPTPNDNTPQAPNASDGSAQKNAPAARSKILAGALLALVLVVGLYYVNRYWISPAVRAQTKSDTNHPLAPDFSLTDINGNPLKLSDYKGKVVALDFWATWCGPCRIEIPSFIELQNRYASQGFALIGISMDDSPEPVVDFYKEFHMNYPVAVGNERLGELYGGMPGLPTTFLIGRDGRIYAKHVGATDPAVFETEIKELLATSPTNEATDFQQAGHIFAEDKVELGNPAAIDSEVPGIDISKLTADQKQAFKKKLEEQHCPCGCNFTLLKCRMVDRQCSISKKLAQQMLDAFLKEKDTGKEKDAGAATNK